MIIWTLIGTFFMIVTFNELRELINFYSRWNFMKTVGLERNLEMLL